MTTSQNQFELTIFAKSDGPLTKRISLGPDGKVKSDGSACLMNSGIAYRARCSDLAAFAAIVGSIKQNEAIALGALRPDLPDRVEVRTKRKLDELNAAPQPGIIARTGDYMTYPGGQPVFALLDFDTKDMPREVAARLESLGGFWAALTCVVPALAKAGRVIRRSTSAGLFRTDTGETLPDSCGLHVFVPVLDGFDTERFLKNLHERCCLRGLGWKTIGAGGQLLERSIVDRMVSRPERLVFEGPPLLQPPLAQDIASRQPVATEGVLLDTAVTCPPLTIVEEAKLREFREKEARRLAPEASKARREFILGQSKRLADRTGISAQRAERVIARQCAGILLPDVLLAFDDKELANATVGDVLSDPGRFEGATLADPLEGIKYGVCKAKVMRSGDGTPWIKSYAHGNTVYKLLHDAQAIEEALQKVPAERVGDTFVSMTLLGETSEDEHEWLRQIACNRAGIGRQTLDAKLKRAREESAERRAREERERRAAERRDPRPQIVAPAPDAPWLPHMQAINDVLSRSPEVEPPMRDMDGNITQVRARPVSSMHLLTPIGVNQGEQKESRLPAPTDTLLTPLDAAQVAELIERYIEYVDETGRPVHLGMPFVRHYLRRNDNVLPVVVAVATLPIVLPNGTIAGGSGLARDLGIIFRVPTELGALLTPEIDCASSAVLEAMQFLTGEWLCDVATDYSGKCILVAILMTILERLVLPERPAFFITAGQRGGGKTTAANMVAVAALGRRASAAAWSASEEERRKAVFAYFTEEFLSLFGIISHAARLFHAHSSRGL
jgi:hypothetical protein